jgi:hypothetical protein
MRFKSIRHFRATSKKGREDKEENHLPIQKNYRQKNIAYKKSRIESIEINSNRQY